MNELSQMSLQIHWRHVAQEEFIVKEAGESEHEKVGRERREQDHGNRSGRESTRVGLRYLQTMIQNVFWSYGSISIEPLGLTLSDLWA